MKWTILVIFSTLFIIPFYSQAKKNLFDDLSSVTVFSIGLNGFVARKLPEQIIYEETLKNKKSTEIFEEIIKSPKSTPESKAYAACGLWENKEKNKIKIDKSDLKKT